MVDPWFVAGSAIVLALTTALAVWKAWRRHAARRRLERMYAAAHHPSRCLVEVLRLLRSTWAGQLMLVIDVRSGQEATLWLPPSPFARETWRFLCGWTGSGCSWICSWLVGFTALWPDADNA